MSTNGCLFGEPWLDEDRPWSERVQLFRECLQSEAITRMDIHEKATPVVTEEDAERKLHDLLEAQRMGDPVNIRLMNEQIQENARQLSRYEERFAYMQGRFDSIDAQTVKLAESVEEIKRKIFNGYDTSIKQTREDVGKIHGLVQDLYRDYVQHSSRPHMEKSEVSSLVDSALNEYDVDGGHMTKDDVRDVVTAAISEYDGKSMREQIANRRWVSNHKLEILAAAGVIAAIVNVVAGFVL